MRDHIDLYVMMSCRGWDKGCKESKGLQSIQADELVLVERSICCPVPSRPQSTPARPQHQAPKIAVHPKSNINYVHTSATSAAAHNHNSNHNNAAGIMPLQKPNTSISQSRMADGGWDG